MECHLCETPGWVSSSLQRGCQECSAGQEWCSHLLGEGLHHHVCCLHPPTWLLAQVGTGGWADLDVQVCECDLHWHLTGDSLPSSERKLPSTETVYLPTCHIFAKTKMSEHPPPRVQTLQLRGGGDQPSCLGGLCFPGLQPTWKIISLTGVFRSGLCYVPPKNSVSFFFFFFCINNKVLEMYFLK